VADRSVVVRLRAEVDRYVAGMQRAKSATTELGKELTGQGKLSQRQLDQLGNTATVVAGGMVLAFGASAKAAIDWESAFAGVEKTVDGTASQMAALEGGLRDLAKELPASHAEIAGVAEAAGQLGVKVGDVEEFTKVMIDLGETTNLSAEEAATSLARISNIMGTATSDVDRMGSTIVELGNNSATTEREIVELATRLAAAGKIAGLSEADVFAFASTLTSVGVEAEAGGTALSKVFTSIRDAVLDGSENLDTFARVAGTTAEDFARSFREDPAMAIESFVTGLGRMNEAGESTTGVFQELELTDQRLMRALLSTAGAGELLAEQIVMANDAWGENAALQAEAEKRYQTTGAQLEMLRNQVVDFGVDMGQVLLPALNGAIDLLGTFAAGFGELPGPMKGALVGIGGIATTVALSTAALIKIVPKVRELRTALLALGPAGKVAAASMPVLAVAGAGIAALTYWMGRNEQAARAAEERMMGYSEAIQNAGDAVAGTTEQIAQLVKGNAEFAALMADSGISATELGEALAGTDEQWEAMRSQMLAAAEAAGVSGMALDAFARGLDDQREAAIKGAENAEDVAEATKGVGDAAEGAKPAVNALGEEMGITADQAKAAEEALKDYLDTLRAAFDPVFGFLDAIDKNREAQDAYNKAVEEGTATQAELDAMLRTVASSALDMEAAATELQAAFARNEVSAEEFTSGLDRLVAQGGITQAMADGLKRQFGLTNDELARFPGDYAANLYAQDNASETIEHVRGQLAALAGSAVTVGINAGLRTPGGGYLGSTGGLVPGGLTPVYRAGGGPIFRPHGTDTIPAMLTEGEYVMRKAAVDRFGVGFMESLNRGHLSPESSIMSQRVDNSRHITIAPTQTITAPTPQRAASDVMYELRLLATGMG
jgi:TP901 family phage tail tape measure protein